MFIGAKLENMQTRKFRTSRMFKNRILSISFAILTFFFFNLLYQFVYKLKSVGMKIVFACFWKAMEIAGSAQKKKKKKKKKKNRVDRVSGNTPKTTTC